MLWFEPAFLKILQHEYAATMHFDSASSKLRQPTPTERPCQLYVHIPFCESLCPFCSFHRVQFRDAKARSYFGALRNEIRSYHARGFQFSDVYVGGGTPTVAPAELVETLALIRSLWPIRTVSVETNPNHLHEEVFTALRSVGVNRLSVGVQSFDDGLLRQMGRYDSYGSGSVIRDRLAAARGVFQTLNVDMIFNLPNQTLGMLDSDLGILRELQVDQVSFYPLMTAASARRKMEKTLGHADQSRRHDFYAHILRAMQDDYCASSAWCFSRKDNHAKGEGRVMIDEYIIDQDNYVGMGSGAFSYVNGWMYSTTFSINQYRERIAGGQSAITQSKRLTLKERMRYDYLVRLFGLELPHEYVRRKYGRKFWLRMAPELAAMRLVGATRHDTDAIRLTPVGMYCWVLMMAEFFNTVNAFRDEMRLHIRAELDTWSAPEVVVPLTAVTRAAKRDAA
jgi:coproporphyrinogen III oxidase-like Fe-S oxidoreductase